VTDVSNAARTCLMDIHSLRWDADLMRRFQVTADMLPAIRSNAEIYGHVREGPLAGVPIAGALVRSLLPASTLQHPTSAQPLHAAQAAWVTSRRPCWGSAAGLQRPRTHTARAASCCSTQGSAQCPPAAACSPPW
jgi:hypothetical protein